MNIELLNAQISKAKELLKEKRTADWEIRYQEYASKILKNMDGIKELKENFHQWKPLYLYMNVTQAKGSANVFNLRYHGQRVANIKFKNEDIILDTKPYQKSNKEWFGIEPFEVTEFPWRSPEAARFRKLFPKKYSLAKSPEHALESMFLSELEKNAKENKDKSLHNIQPVKIAGICRFQMPTPLQASKAELTYAGSGGGGIDILARTGAGRGAGLCIMELKQGEACKNPEAAMLQGLAYAVFLQELLASKSGRDWFSIFGFSAKKSLNKPPLKVCIVMPHAEEKLQKSYDQVTIETDLGALGIRYIYLSKDWQNELQVQASNLF